MRITVARFADGFSFKYTSFDVLLIRLLWQRTIIFISRFDYYPNKKRQLYPNKNIVKLDKQKTSQYLSGTM